MSSPVEHDYAEAMPPAMGFTDSAAKKVSHLMETRTIRTYDYEFT